MSKNTLRIVLGLYSAVFTFTIIFAGVKSGQNPSLLFLIPLPLYFIISIVRQTRRLYRHLNQEFVTESYTRIPVALDLRFLITQTSPTFLITICLLSAAIGGTIIKAILQ